MILSAIAEKLKCRAKGDFKGRHFEATLILQAVSWYADPAGRLLVYCGGGRFRGAVPLRRGRRGD